MRPFLSDLGMSGTVRIPYLNDTHRPELKVRTCLIESARGFSLYSFAYTWLNSDEEVDNSIPSKIRLLDFRNPTERHKSKSLEQQPHGISDRCLSQAISGKLVHLPILSFLGVPASAGKAPSASTAPPSPASSVHPH